MCELDAWLMSRRAESCAVPLRHCLDSTGRMRTAATVWLTRLESKMSIALALRWAVVGEMFLHLARQATM